MKTSHHAYNNWSNTHATASRSRLSLISHPLHNTSYAVLRSVAGESSVPKYPIMLSTTTSFLRTVMLKPVHPGIRSAGWVFNFLISMQVRYSSLYVKALPLYEDAMVRSLK